MLIVTGNRTRCPAVPEKRLSLTLYERIAYTQQDLCCWTAGASDGLCRTGAPPGTTRAPSGTTGAPPGTTVYVGPAPRRERPAPRGEYVRPEALFFPGGAPVLPVLAWYVPVPGIRFSIL